MTYNLDAIINGICTSNPNFSPDLIKTRLTALQESIVALYAAPMATKGECMRWIRERADDEPFIVPNDALSFMWDESKAIIEGSHQGDLVFPASLKDDLIEFYHNGYDSGMQIFGWPKFAEHYRIARREMTVITGIPGHGKSEFLDAILIKLALDSNWKFAVFSPENYPHSIHIEKFLSKVNGKPFHKGKTERMDERAVIDGLSWIDEHFTFIAPHEDELTLDAVLSLAKKAIDEKKIDGFIIDPWNEIEHSRPERQSETEYVGESLMRIRRFARKHNIALWIVAHPAKLYRDKHEGATPIPRAYDIAGSAHWFNKADNVLCVYRKENTVDVHIQKIKFKMRGKVGCVEFVYDRVNGQYSEMGQADAAVPYYENF